MAVRATPLWVVSLLAYIGSFMSKENPDIEGAPINVKHLKLVSLFEFLISNINVT